jgi:hypothetical protein
MRIFETHKQANENRHIYGETYFRCSVCNDVKNTPEELNGIGTGYAVQNDKMICYSCADEIQREEMKTETHLFLYVSQDWKHITTWSGGTVGRIAKVGSLHSWSRERRYISAVDDHGNKWHGVGSNGMYCKIRKGKKQ